jgi:hypothetical protein
MSSPKSSLSILIASATAALALSAGADEHPAMSKGAAGDGKGPGEPFCQNSQCKGHSECHGHGNASCGGRNSCRGKGWIGAASPRICAEKGGKWVRAKAPATRK